MLACWTYFIFNVYSILFCSFFKKDGGIIHAKIRIYSEITSLHSFQYRIFRSKIFILIKTVDPQKTNNDLEYVFFKNKIYKQFRNIFLNFFEVTHFDKVFVHHFHEHNHCREEYFDIVYSLIS